MKGKPEFGGMYKGRDFRNQMPGYWPVVMIASDGKNFTIDFSETLLPHFTEELLERMMYCLKDGFYRVRPDLRKQ